MKLELEMLSLSATNHNFKKGDRVVVKVKKNEWYIGTVKRAGVKVTVDFDDGLDAVIEQSDFKHLKLMVKAKKLKRALTDEEAKALYGAIKKTEKPVAKPKSDLGPKIKKIKPKQKVTVDIPAAPVKPNERPAAPSRTKDGWHIALEPITASRWRYVVVDDPKHATFRQQSQFVFGTAELALRASLNHFKGEAFTLLLRPMIDGVGSGDLRVAFLAEENVSAKNANKALTKLLSVKAKISDTQQTLPSFLKHIEIPKEPSPAPKAPEVKPEPKPEPVPTPVPPSAPKKAESIVKNWVVQLVPSSDGNMWSYAVKDNVQNPQVMKVSEFEFDTALQALKSVVRFVAELRNVKFQLRMVTDLKGNAIVAEDVADNITINSAVEQLQRWMKANSQIGSTFIFNPPEPKKPDGPAPIRVGGMVSEDNWDTVKTDEVPLYLQAALPIMFEKIKTDADRIKYMQHVHKKANMLIFDNRLQLPNIRFLKEQQAKSFRRRGHWQASKNEIAMSRRVFNAGEDKFLEIFVHEMCHQAVSRLDRVIDTNKGHGPYWTAWMVKAGIPPSRYDMTDTQEYMHDAEKEETERKANAMKEAYAKAVLIPNPREGTIGRFWNTNASKWEAGIVCGIDGDKMIFATSSQPAKDGWMWLGNRGKGRVFKLEMDFEEDMFRTPEWSTVTEQVKSTIQRMKALKKFKRDLNSGFIGR